MSDVKQANELVKAAGRDISALRGMSDPQVFADEIYGLHTQQAAEKLLKAWLALLGEVYPLTHNLELLLSILQERGVATEELKPLVEYTRMQDGSAMSPVARATNRSNAQSRCVALRLCTNKSSVSCHQAAGNPTPALR